MSFRQASDLLKAAGQFHRDLREYFEASRGDPQRERVRLLLDYLAARERDLEAEPAHAPRGALETYFQFADENKLGEASHRRFTYSPACTRTARPRSVPWSGGR